MTCKRLCRVVWLGLLVSAVVVSSAWAGPTPKALLPIGPGGRVTLGDFPRLEQVSDEGFVLTTMMRRRTGRPPDATHVFLWRHPSFPGTAPDDGPWQRVGGPVDLNGFDQPEPLPADTDMTEVSTAADVDGARMTVARGMVVYVAYVRRGRIFVSRARAADPREPVRWQSVGGAVNANAPARVGEHFDVTTIDDVPTVAWMQATRGGSEMRIVQWTGRGWEPAELARPESARLDDEVRFGGEPFSRFLATTEPDGPRNRVEVWCFDREGTRLRPVRMNVWRVWGDHLLTAGNYLVVGNTVRETYEAVHHGLFRLFRSPGVTVLEIDARRRPASWRDLVHWMGTWPDVGVPIGFTAAPGAESGMTARDGWYLLTTLAPGGRIVVYRVPADHPTNVVVPIRIAHRSVQFPSPAFTPVRAFVTTDLAVIADGFFRPLEDADARPALPALMAGQWRGTL